MNLKLTFILILYSLIQTIAEGQPQAYTVEKTSFSTDRHDEFCPVFYKNMIVFVTNGSSGSISSYSDTQNHGLLKIFSVERKNNNKWSSASLFSKELKTHLNDGPVTFNSSQDTIYYSRNLRVEGKPGDLNRGRNNLGIFYAVFNGKKWDKIHEMRINSEWYNISTPCLSEDGKTLYFASDRPGGYGGTDLYYSIWENGYWSDPVNLGPVINTKGNESYPYVNPAGEFFFSSDGHGGLGGKDIFFSRQEGGIWITPVRLDAPINSEFDDFGIVTDTLMNEGFFSSARGKTIDIYHFKTNIPQVFYNTIQKRDQFCFTFKDSNGLAIDTTDLRYVWIFGNRDTCEGKMVTHCFPGPGEYNVKLDLVDKVSGAIFFTKLAYKIELRNYNEAYIMSQDVDVKGDSMIFSGKESEIPGYKILDFFWNFGDGSVGKGENVSHVFKESGQFTINLTLTVKSIATGMIHRTGSSRLITITNTSGGKENYISKNSPAKADFQNIGNAANVTIIPEFSAETESSQPSVFQVELLSSGSGIGLNSSTFRSVIHKFDIKEDYSSKTGLYSYITPPRMNLMDTYFEFKQIVEAGFGNARVKMKLLTDPAQKELFNLMKIFGTRTDFYFGNNSRLTANAYLLLDQVAGIMTKYPEIRLEVEVHTDNGGSPERSLRLSQIYAQEIVRYLKDKGIPGERLQPKGFGESMPIAHESAKDTGSINRRIAFTVIR